MLQWHVLVGQNLLLVQDFYYQLFTFNGLQKTFLIFFFWLTFYHGYKHQEAFFAMSFIYDQSYFFSDIIRCNTTSWKSEFFSCGERCKLWKYFFPMNVFFFITNLSPLFPFPFSLPNFLCQSCLHPKFVGLKCGY